MHNSRLSNVIAVCKYAFLAVGGSTTIACASGVPPSSSLSVDPTSLTFADAQSAAQQVVVTGGQPPRSSNATNLGAQCFSVQGTTTSTTSTTFTVAPQSGALGACIMDFYAQNAQAAYIPVVSGIQMQPYTTATYTVVFVGQSTGSATLTSTNAQVAAVPSSVTATDSTSIGVPVVTFTITSSAVLGSAVIHIFENGASQPPTFSIPVLVTTQASPTPAPTGVPTATPSAAPTGAPTATPTTAPTASPTPGGNAFILTNSSSQAFTLAGSPVAAQVSFFGQVTINGAASENVTYAEATGVPPNGCSVSGTVVDAITLNFPIAFSFAPNGSFGPNTGLLDTLFAPPSPSGTYYGTLFQAGSCATPFDAAAQAISAPPSSYEYPGGGNTSVAAGTYILELWH